MLKLKRSPRRCSWCRGACSAKSPDTLEVRSVLGEISERQGNFAQAEALFTTVLDARRRTLGQDHPQTLEAWADLDRVYLERQKYAEAEAALREALKASERTQRAGQQDDTRSLLGASLAGQGKYSEAEPLLLSGYNGLIQQESAMSVPDRVHVKDAGQRIVELYRRWGQTEKAAEWKQRLQVARLKLSN